MRTQRREKTQINKTRDEKGDRPQILMNSRGSLKSTLKAIFKQTGKST
jgi:hypothetical protein